MTLSSATITYDLGDLAGTSFDTRRTKIWATTNIPGNTITDGATEIRIGDAKGTLADDGTGSIIVVVPGAGTNPATWQTTIHVDYSRRGSRDRVVRDFGPFTITATGDLADLIPEQDVPASYATGLLSEMQALRDEVHDISNIDTTDSAMETVRANPATAFATGLSAALNQQVVVTGGALKVKGTSVAPENVGAATPTTELRIPASALVPSRGSVDAALTHLDGRPIRALTRTLRLLASFTAADSATSAGATIDTGQAVTVTGTWGISTNRLYNPSAINGNRWTVDSGVSKHAVHATIAVLPSTSQVQLVARFTDASNYVAVGISSTGQLILSDTVASTFTSRATSATGAVVAGDRVTLDCTIDGRAQVRVNGAVVLNSYAIGALSGTITGVRNAGDTGGAFRIDDFAVGDDQRLSAAVTIPTDWHTFDVVAEVSNASTAAATGTARFQYGEQALALTGTAETPVKDTGAAATLAMPTRGTYSEVYLASGRTRPASGVATVAVVRTNANAADTFGDTVALTALILRKAS